MKVYNNPLDIPIPPAIYENTVEGAYRQGVINAQATLPWEPVTKGTEWERDAYYVIREKGRFYTQLYYSAGQWTNGKSEIDLKQITHRIKITPPEAEGISDAS